MIKIPKEDKLRILTWDIETAPKTAYIWQLGKQHVKHTQLISDSFILCIAWKWLGEKKTHAVYLTPKECKAGKDARILKEFSAQLNKADYYVGHNIDGYDVKMVNVGLIKNNLPPITPSKSLDTLKLARRYFRFTSNKLDAICQDLGIGRKADTGGFQTWVDCMTGSTKAMKRMVKYNKQDVAINEVLFEKLRPFITLQTKLSTPIAYDAERMSSVLARHICNNCGSKGMHVNKKYMTKAGNIRLAGRCKSCHSCATVAGGRK